MPTHGSLTKAGKVRTQTPKLKPSTRHLPRGPLTNNHKQYLKLLRKERSPRRRRRR